MVTFLASLPAGIPLTLLLEMQMRPPRAAPFPGQLLLLFFGVESSAPGAPCTQRWGRELRLFAMGPSALSLLGVGKGNPVESQPART